MFVFIAEQTVITPTPPCSPAQVLALLEVLNRGDGVDVKGYNPYSGALLVEIHDGAVPPLPAFITATGKLINPYA